ncbi:MAG: MerR family transcriptional regulator [Pyramidobacter sp.]|nr:MerR family transcriptional regulator [Pyramidobacter sp.]MBP3752313.1 MerR family transcriptional regulator [Pyramidobacter sp.]
MVVGMKEACVQTGLAYETLKYYCNEGLVPNVKRDANNRRVFDERTIAWIKDLHCLKRCGMSIEEMKRYLDLCLKGPSSIDERMVMIHEKRAQLLAQMEELKDSLSYLDWKENFYNDVQSGKIPYRSNLIRIEE